MSEKTKRPPRCFPGAVFGRLTLQEKAGRENGRTLWTCACVCGGTKVVADKDLRRERTTSCGCLRAGPKPGATPEEIRAFAEDVSRRYKRLQPYIGASFGLLTVREHLGVIDKRRRWQCTCECGGGREVDSQSLLDGHIKSCGCLKPGPKTKAEKMAALKGKQARARAAKPAKVKPAKAPKPERAKVKPAPRVVAPANPMARTPTPEMRAMHNKTMSALTKPAKPHTDLGPRKSGTGSAHITPPAQRATGPNVTVRELPAYDLRFGVDPNTKVVGGFASLGVGRYLEVAA